MQSRKPGFSSLLPNLEAARQRVMAQVPPLPHLSDPEHLEPQPEHASQMPFGGEYRSNATMLMLARNSDLMGVLQSVREAEDRFNRNYKYPWVFLNEEDFTDEFKMCVVYSPCYRRSLAYLDVAAALRTSSLARFTLARSRASIGISRTGLMRIVRSAAATSLWRIMLSTAVRLLLLSSAMSLLMWMRGVGSVSYRNMCRFNSGFFYHHELLQQFKWYWRVEYVPFSLSRRPFAFLPPRLYLLLSGLLNIVQAGRALLL